MEKLSLTSSLLQSKANAAFKDLQNKVAPTLKKTIAKGEEKLRNVIKFLNGLKMIQ